MTCWLGVVRQTGHPDNLSTNSHNVKLPRVVLGVTLVGVAANLNDSATMAAVGGSVVDGDGGFASGSIQGPHTSLPRRSDKFFKSAKKLKFPANLESDETVG